MKTNILIISVTSMIALMGLGVQSSLADPEYGYSRAYSSEHGCGEEMLGHRGHPADHLRHLLQHHKEIGLTDEQVKKLKAIELDFDRARIRSSAEIHVAERELLALVEEEKTDLSAIEAKVTQSEMLEVGLRMLAFKARHDALGILTPEQREKGKAGHEKRMHEMMSGRHGGVPSGGVWAQTQLSTSDRGQRIYQRNCLHCHGVTLDGKGPDAASLSVPPANFHTYLSRLKDDAEFEKTIKQGKQFLGMHNWEDSLTEEQVHDLIAYIRSAAPSVNVKP